MCYNNSRQMNREGETKMMKFRFCAVIAVSIYTVAGISTIARADYSKTITTTDPYVNLPRPKDDPRWAQAFSHWDKRKSTKEVLAAIEIFESLACDKPNKLEPQLWLTRAYHLAAMRKRKGRDGYAKKGIAAGKRALVIDPGNIYAGFWHNTSLVLLREPTKAEYKGMRAYNVKLRHLRELPVPADDPLWAQAMKLWDKRLTAADIAKLEAKIAGGKKLTDEHLKPLKAKGLAVIGILNKLEKKYPDRIEPRLWLLRATYWMVQVSADPKIRAKWGKAGMQWGFKALEMEPQNPAANFLTASCIGEYGAGTSIAVIIRYSRQIGKQILMLTEENPNYMYVGFSRFFAVAVATVGKLVFKVAAFLGFPQELIERLTDFSVKSEPGFLANQYCLGLMYDALGRKDDAKKMFETLINADPTVLKYQEPENRMIQFIAKLKAKELFK